MLILTRQLDESINIGDEVVVTVLDIKGGQVRLGIEAPRDISVHREEIYNRILEETSKINEKAELVIETNASVIETG